MSSVRIKEDGTKVTTPAWVIIPCALTGAGTALSLCWALLFEHGSLDVRQSEIHGRPQ